MSGREPIALVGVGCRFPGDVNTPSALWDLLTNPRDLLTPIPEDRFSARGFYHSNSQYHGHTNVQQSYFLGGDKPHRRFDAQFFGISPAEARVMDPQVRLLLETVYEALEDSGSTIDGLQGSSTAVYSGVMVYDYEHIMNRDENAMGIYHVTGTARALISNRISYFFDWHGPSMTIDTACSSSLYAVHHAVQQLRSGGSRVAIATGCNLLLDPYGYVTESKMQMLSPSGRSRMWDASADGYARGEGVAAVVLKTLSAAEADGDHIYCVIRETAVNQDGRTKGITVPSSKAQAAMIRECYARAALNINNPSDRPQFFEAHGTGTQAGDPIEAEAISSAFLSKSCTPSPDPLYVGSIKTIIGHTEGTAGLAGLIKAALAIQNSAIPSNLLFNRLNPRIQPFYTGLNIPTSTIPWPAVPAGTPRRASVNSFGFGGANAHAILESHPQRPTQYPTPETPVFSPFIFSAASEISLSESLAKFRDFLVNDGQSLGLRDLAFTLHSRRTRFAQAIAFSASTVDELASKIDTRIMSSTSDPTEPLGTRARQNPGGSTPRVLGIFTGQGAQWARMGFELITSSAAARQIIDGLDAALASLPLEDRPLWTIAEELQKEEGSSRIGDAVFSQPICTAVQIMLVDILKSAGVEFTAVVGHSSGEIAASYAAGRLSANAAIRVAYYRGLSMTLEQAQPKAGAMMAVRTSQEDMEELLQEPEFEGRAWIAAINSSASITVSGDMDAIEELGAVLKDEKKTYRILKVDKAYHSPHMLPYSKAYLASQEKLDIQVNPPSQCTWISTVYDDDNARLTTELKGQYWNNNLLNPVLFSQGVETAWADKGPFDVVVEIGPHSTLKGPVLQTFQDIADQTVPYTSLLQRGSNDIKALAEGLAYISLHLGKGSVDFCAFETFLSGSSKYAPVQGLPSYAWNHEGDYWHESRYAKAISQRPNAVHELLGHLAPDCSSENMRWRHLLRPKEVPWLKGHQLQGQIVFPAAAFVATALEACLAVSRGDGITFIELSDVEITQALTFDDEDSGVEVVFSLANLQRHDKFHVTAEFYYSAATGKGEGMLDSLAHGSMHIFLGEPSPNVLPSNSLRPTNMIAVTTDDFYDSLTSIGYEYSGPFVALSNLRRKLGAVTGSVSDVEESQLLVHPALLDSAFQAIILAASSPGDGRLWSMHIPNKIKRIRVNPALCTALRESGRQLTVEASQPSNLLSRKGDIKGDVNIVPADSSYAMIQVEGLKCVPFSPANAEDDKAMFSSTVWGPSSPDASKVVSDGVVTPKHYDLAYSLERMACFYLRKLDQEVPSDHPSRSEGPYRLLFGYASHISGLAKKGAWSFWRSEWDDDTRETITALSLAHSGVPDVNLLRAIGPRLTDIVMNRTSAIEIGMQDDLLSQFYQKGLGMPEYLSYLARTIRQILHRSPRIQCLEIGAGTGAATKAIQHETDMSFSSYTFTDVSSGFFDAARAGLGSDADRMIFKALDISKDPISQGFAEHSYDLIVASMVIHATPSLTQTLKNVRRLLRPGGYLVVLEVNADLPARMGTIFGAFPGWWLGAEDGRTLSPCVHLPQWNELLRETGFSGCDTTTPDLDPLVQPFTIFVSQALDEEIAFLRDPLALPTIPSPAKLMSDLVVVGGDSSTLAAEAGALLEAFYEQVHCISSLQDFESLRVGSNATVLCLADLEEPVFRNLTEATWDSLKLMLQDVGCVLWVTQGRRARNPHSNMTIGLLRSAIDEFPGLDFQFLDIEDEGRPSAESISKALLCFKAACLWKREDHSRFTNLIIEPELVIDKDGNEVVPRLVMNKTMNDRYNSSRREISIQSTFDNRNNTVSIVDSGSGYSLRQIPLDLFAADAEKTVSSVRVSCSLLAPVRVTRRDSLFFSIGQDENTLTPVLALSTSNASVVRPAIYIPLSTDSPLSFAVPFLRLVIIYHLVSSVFEDLDEGDRVWFHEPESEYIDIVEAEAKRSGINVIFTTTRDDMPHDCVKIHPNATQRSLEALEPLGIAVFLNFAATDAGKRVAKEIQACLPVFCRCETVQTVYRGLAKVPSAARVGQIRMRLQEVIAKANSQLAAFTETSIGNNDIGLAEVPGVPNELAHRYIVDWTIGSEVPTQIQPVDAGPLFSATKTYWLVGLTGTLGLSLSEWMIRHGARYIVVSSRTPNIDERWVEEMAAIGGKVKISSCDVTRLSELKTTYAEICSTMPPIAGVAQGAMVLDDIRFSNTSFDILQKVTRPKVEGSINLDALLQDTALDFFVFFSSTSSIVGTPGQSAYSAANQFMVSLAEQRRQRGLAASVIHIGPVYGVGYVAQNRIDVSVMRLLGVKPISESDFHQLFAEAVLAGNSRSNLSVDITTGIVPVQWDEEAQPRWAANPIMSHWVLNGKAVDNVAVTKSKASLKVKLHAARSRDEVDNVVKQALIEKLGSLLHLSMESLSDNTNFDIAGLDELGVDSLMATEIRSWLMKSLEVNVPVLKILSGLSVKELVIGVVDAIDPSKIPNAQFIRSDNTTSTSATTPESRPSSDDDSVLDQTLSTVSELSLKDGSEGDTTIDRDRLALPTVDLSLTQGMFWIASTLFDNKSSLNVSGVARISGQLRISDFRDAVRALGQKHESFRTCFFVSDGKVMQYIMESSHLDLEYREIDSEGEVEIYRREVESHVYDLTNGKTCRVILLSLAPDTHFLVVGTTHLCFDGFSIQVFLRDLFRHYSHQPEVKMALQYKDYVQMETQALASGSFNKELRFWKEQYPDFPPILPILRVSSATSRPSLTAFNHIKVDVKIERKTRSAIQNICREHRITPFQFFLSCFRVLLARYSDTEDVTIGVSDAHRNNEGTEDCIGVFVNVLPVRFRTSLASKFNEVIQDTKANMLNALRNSNVPYQAVLNELDPPRSSTFTPIFQSFINYRQVMNTQISDECGVELLSIEPSRTGYDLNLDILDDPQDCRVTLFARDGLYQRAEADTLVKSYKKLIKAFVEEPAAPLAKPVMYDHGDVQAALRFSQSPPRTSMWPATVIHRFDDIAKINPDQVAVKSRAAGSLTYSELLRLSGSIANTLTLSGAKLGSRIALLQEPSPRWIASILAILRIGGVYLPLDLSTPFSRLATIFKDCQPHLVLVDTESEHHISKLEQPDLLAINISLINDETQTPPISATAEGQAVLLYTSGSTGVPKGIMLKHDGILNQIEPTQEIYRIDAEVVLQQSASSFDLSYLQIFTALCFGGSLYLLPRELRADASAITDIIASEGITYTLATPTECSSWLRYGQTDSISASSWRTAVCAGEAVSEALLTQLRNLQKSELHFFNAYGPTELGVATAMEVAYQDPENAQQNRGKVAGGFTLPNCAVYVVDEQLNLVPPGVQGEIYLGGACVAVGYVNNASLTDEKFVPNVFASSEFRERGWTRMHRVGDLGRWREDGALVIEGRVSGDTHIKLRGFRIDLQEIETAILEAADGFLSEVIVSVRQTSSSAPEFLIAHVVFHPTSPESRREDLLHTLSSSIQLPRYMHPAAIIPLQQMPMTSSGKLDRRAISSLPIPKMAKDTKQSPPQQGELSPVEKKLRELWIQVIQQQVRPDEEITTSTDFFNAGGTSLLLLELQAQMKAEFGVKPPVTRMMEFSTLGGMASLLSDSHPAPRKAMVDWDQETALPRDILTLIQQSHAPTLPPTPTSEPITIVLTGATGYLGTALLTSLVASPQIKHIHCIGIRNASHRPTLSSLPKVSLWEGDLKLPRLGLSAAASREVFRAADAVVHNGAEVSHMQSYHSLRLPNTASTLELVRTVALEAGRRVPVHFVSTAQVGVYFAENARVLALPEVSVAAHPPPRDGSEGYAASK